MEKCTIMTKNGSTKIFKGTWDLCFLDEGEEIHIFILKTPLSFYEYYNFGLLIDEGYLQKNHFQIKGWSSSVRGHFVSFEEIDNAENIKG